MSKIPVLLLFAFLSLVLISGCENKEMKQEIESAKANLVKIKADLAKTLSENKELAEVVEGFKAKVAKMTDLEKAKADLEAKYQVLINEKDAMAKQLNDAKAKATSLMEKIKGYTSQIKDLEGANAKLQDMIEQLKGKADGLIEKTAEGVEIPSLQ